MATKTGTHSIADLLANKQTTAAEFGLDTINAVLTADIEAHNRIVDQLMSEVAEVSSDRQRLSGSSDAGEMQEVDEFGRSPTQKPAVGVTVGFPLRLKQYAIGWTRKWFETHTPADMAIATQGAEKAHLRGIQRDIKRAIYGSANYTFFDRLVAPQVNLAVKRFLNADSTSIPEGPNGETFNGATHTHYLGTATLTDAGVLSLVRTILEHGIPSGGSLRLAIAQADRTAFEALTGFSPYPDPRLIPTQGDNQQTIALGRLDNLAIGTYDAAEVWVKPWAIANYVAAYIANGDMKPLVYRTRGGQSDLRVAAELDAYPLHAKYMETEYGVGVWNRSTGGVLYFANATYADPTIT